MDFEIKSLKGQVDEEFCIMPVTCDAFCHNMLLSSMET